VPLPGKKKVVKKSPDIGSASCAIGNNSNSFMHIRNPRDNTV